MVRDKKVKFDSLSPAINDAVVSMANDAINDIALQEIQKIRTNPEAYGYTHEDIANKTSKCEYKNGKLKVWLE